MGSSLHLSVGLCTLVWPAGRASGLCQAPGSLPVRAEHRASALKGQVGAAAWALLCVLRSPGEAAARRGAGRPPSAGIWCRGWPAWLVSGPGDPSGRAPQGCKRPGSEAERPMQREGLGTHCSSSAPGAQAGLWPEDWAALAVGRAVWSCPSARRGPGAVGGILRVSSLALLAACH